MVALKELFHKWISATHATMRPLSYVGNWGVILRSVDYMERAVQAVDSFAKALGIELDAARSYRWAVDGDSRRLFREGGFRVLLQNRELGAHCVCARQLANATTLDRFREFLA